MHGQKRRLDDFMRDALSRYYDTRDPFGQDGDFITAPEISQLFGEMIGIWAVQKWQAMGKPTDFNLIEIGPGRGTLMADLLRGTRKQTDFQSAAHITLIETSRTLKQKQQDALSDYDVTWHDHLSAVTNDLPTIIIANEFFDALPVRQFKYTDQQWHERYIEGGKDLWIASLDTPVKPSLPAPHDGAIMEYSDVQAGYAALLSQYNGAFLFIDYGYIQSAYGDSLQALYRHAPCTIFDHVGEADLTTHVDFQWLSTFFKKTTVKAQAQFLEENGITLRLQMLNDDRLRSGYHRLMSPDQMGALFKVMDVQNYTV